MVEGFGLRVDTKHPVLHYVQVVQTPKGPRPNHTDHGVLGPKYHSD